MEPNFPTRPLIGLLLRLLYQEYAKDIDAALREAGFGDIRPAHSNVFPFVPPEGISISRLAELARVRKQTMAEAVEQLERMGYIERRPNPVDRRSRLIFLTERGTAIRTHHARDRGTGRKTMDGTDQSRRVGSSACLAPALTDGAADPVTDKREET